MTASAVRASTRPASPVGAPFIDECPGLARAIPCPPPVPSAFASVRLPTPLRQDAPACPARPTSSPRALCPRPPWTGAARRLLQSVAIHEHDLEIVQTPPTTAAVACRSSGRASEPARDVKPFDLTPPWRVAADLSAGGRSPPHLGTTPLARAPFHVAANRDEPAQGLRRANPTRHLPPRSLAPGASPRDPLGSDTSCRELAATWAGVAHPAVRPANRPHHHEPARQPRFREPAHEGRVPVPPRRSSRVRRTRGAFPRRTAPMGPGPVLHNLSPACGLPGTGAFSFADRSRR